MVTRGGSPEAGPGSGCSVHRTPQGQVCGHCRDQGQLFTRAVAARQTRPRKKRGGRDE